MGAKHVPQPFVAAFVEQMQIDFAQRRQESVGVGDGMRFAVFVAHLEAIVDQVDERQRYGEQAGVDVLQREPVVADKRDHLGGVRAEGPDDGVVAVFVRAQSAVRIVMFAGYQPRQLTGFGRQAGSGDFFGGLHCGVTSGTAAGFVLRTVRAAY